MSVGRLWATARLDLAHNLRRPLFWIFVVILGLVAWGFSSGDMRIQSGDSTVGGTKAFITSQFAVAQMLSVFVLLLYAFFVAVGAGMTVLRDEELNVGEVIHATPLSPREYAWGKFLAVLVSFIVILAINLGLMAFFNHVVTNAEDAEFIGPFALGNYVVPALVFALPTIVFMAGLTFWIGTRFKRPILVFFLPVALLLGCVFFLWDWSPDWLPESVNSMLVLVDPAGYRWLTETWLDVDRGVEFYNSAPIVFDSAFVASRIVFAALGLLAAGLAARHFARTSRGPHAKTGAAALPDPATAPGRESITPEALGSLGMRTERPGLLAGIFAVTRVEFRELRASPGLYLFIPLIVLETIANASFFTGPFDTDPLLTPGILAVRSVGWLAGLVSLMLLFYTVESLRREDGTGLASIHYSTPVRTASMLFGKALANSLVGVVTIAVTLLTSLIVLAAQGRVALDVWPFILVWCVILLPTFLVWCSFVSLLYAIARSRYTTYALGLAAFIWTSYESQVGEMNWLWNWPLWSALQWSDMGTFELVREELVLNRLLALTATLLFTILTVRLFPRRQADATNRLLRLAPRPLLVGVLRYSPVIALPVAAAIALGGRIDAGFQGDALEKAAKDYWRKNVATWTDARDPDLTSVDVDLELHPERRAFEVQGTFRLENRHEKPLPVIAMTRGFGWRGPDSLRDGADPDGETGPIWTLDGEPFEPEDAAGLMIFRLPEALAWGTSVEVGFHHSGDVPFGATENGGGSPEFILPSGIVLTSFRPTFVPTVGYDEQVGVDDDNRYDSKEYPDDFYEGVTRALFGGGFTPYHVRMRVSAPEQFTINGVGVLQSEEVAGGRRTVVWETDRPVRFFNVVAGRWAVARGTEGTAIYYHPEHTYNIEAMVEALDGARRHYSEWFYPYPWKELKLSQFPALASYAQGFPTNITFSEAIGFLLRASGDDADAPFFVTAHESAHQWWGNILVPGEGPGANILSEGMAHFSTLLLFEEMRGLEGRIAFAKKIEARYGENRQADSERPLVKIDGTRPGDTTVTYDKGGLVFGMLLDHMGRSNCLAGLQSFIAHYSHDRDHPVLQDFVAHMRQFAPEKDAFDEFVQQWFFDVVVPEYSLEDVERIGDPESGWTVTLTIENVGTGVMPIEVAATAGTRFADADESPAPGEVLAAERAADPAAGYREVRKTVTLGPDECANLVFECAFEPEQVIVDPDARVLMLRRKLAVHEF